MKSLKWKAWAAAILAGAALAGGVWVRRAPRVATGTVAGRTAALYQCPMHPQIVRPEPGQCPICHMPLQRMETEAAAGGGSQAERSGMSIAPDRQQLIGVRTAVVESRDISHDIRSSGRVAHDPDLYSAIAEYIQAVQSSGAMEGGRSPEARAMAESLVRSSRTRLKLMGLPDGLVDELAKAGTPPQHLILPLPEGRVWIYADIYQDELSLVKPGQRVELRLAGRGEANFEGRVLSVDPVVDPQTRTARARIEAENRGGALKPEMYLDVLIHVQLGRRLAVPRDAVLDTGERQIAFVVEGERFEPREVRIRGRGEDYVEVASGLAAGERVVSSANFLIDSESRLRAALEAFQSKKAAGGRGADRGGADKPGGEAGHGTHRR